MAGRARRLAGALPSYARIAWWGLVAPRRETRPLVVHQAVVLSDEGVLLAVRSELRGWELPGGSALPGESGEQAVAREVREETGIEVAVERCVARFERSGFRPHTACIYRCRAVGGRLRPSDETPRVAWFAAQRIPGTLFPWYREPLRLALAPAPEVVERSEHQGVAAVLHGLAIDLRMRWSEDAGGAGRALRAALDGTSDQDGEPPGKKEAPGRRRPGGFSDSEGGAGASAVPRAARWLPIPWRAAGACARSRRTRRRTTG